MARTRVALVISSTLLLSLSVASVQARSGSVHASGAAKESVVALESPSNERPRARPVPRVAAAEEPASADRALPGSLLETEVDGALDLGPGGHLVLGPRVIALFDYFLSATGEESDALIRARIEAHLGAHLVEPALGEARALLGRYLDYREASRALTVSEGAAAEERLASVHGLRREHLGEAAEALFGEEERLAERALHRSRPGEAGSGDLAGALDDAEARASSVIRLRAEEEALRVEGADEAVLRDHRESALGPEAAERLGALDRQRAAWKGRIEAFQMERASRCGEGPDRARCEDALLARAFEPREQIRVRTILALR